MLVNETAKEAAEREAAQIHWANHLFIFRKQDGTLGFKLNHEKRYAAANIQCEHIGAEILLYGKRDSWGGEVVWQDWNAKSDLGEEKQVLQDAGFGDISDILLGIEQDG